MVHCIGEQLVRSKSQTSIPVLMASFLFKIKTNVSGQYPNAIVNSCANHPGAHVVQCTTNHASIYLNFVHTIVFFLWYLSSIYLPGPSLKWDLNSSASISSTVWKYFLDLGRVLGMLVANVSSVSKSLQSLSSSVDELLVSGKRRGCAAHRIVPKASHTFFFWFPSSIFDQLMMMDSLVKGGVQPWPRLMVLEENVWNLLCPINI